jgi:hypothetical protein
VNPQKQDIHFPEFFTSEINSTHLMALLLINQHQSYLQNKHPFSTKDKDQNKQNFLDLRHQFTLCSTWNLIREARRRKQGCFGIESLVSPLLRVFTFRVIGKTFDTRLKEAEKKFEKFIIKTEKVVSKGIDLGYAFSQKRLLCKLEEQGAQIIFKNIVQPMQVKSNRLDSYEIM